MEFLRDTWAQHLEIRSAQHNGGGGDGRTLTIAFSCFDRTNKTDVNSEPVQENFDTSGNRPNV